MWMAVTFFLLAGAQGFWYPMLSSVLGAYGLDDWVALAFMLPPVMSFVSPLIFGAQVDQRWQAQKVLAWVMGLSGLTLFGAYYVLSANWGAAWFIAIFAFYSLIYAPAWSLLTVTTLSNLENPERAFGPIRVWATIGWGGAGFLVSWLGFDQSARTGMIGAGVCFLAALTSLLLPQTPPKGEVSGRWSDAMGFGALKLLKDRDLFVYFMTALVFMIPVSAYYIYTPKFLKELGVDQVGAALGVAQIFETFAMFAMGWVMARYRAKSILLFAILCSVVRFVFYSFEDVNWLLAGIALQGILWTYFFEGGRVFLHRRVPGEMRGQAQTLLGVFTGGFGSLIGTFLVTRLHSTIVPSYGWSLYWQVLMGVNVVAFLIFFVGYRGGMVKAGVVEGA